MKKILLVGTYPPPYGGSSVFVLREQQFLQRHGFDVPVFDTLPEGKIGTATVIRRPMLSFLFSRGQCADVIHIHAHSAKIKILFSLKAALCHARLIISYHSYRTPLKGFRKLANRIALSLCDEIWVNDEGTRSGLQRDFRIDEERVVLFRHFLPPTDDEFRPEPLDQRFLNFSQLYSPLLMTSAWKLMQVDGQDLYGGDLCLRLVALLRKTHPQIGLVFFVGRNDFPDRLHLLEVLATELGIGDRVLFLVGDHRTLPYLKSVDLFLRCTRSDTLGASVLESLVAGVPVVASDVCPRPPGTVVFHAEDIHDLYVKAEEVLAAIAVDKTVTAVENYDESPLISRILALTGRG